MRPLDGITVIDLTRVLSVPTAPCSSRTWAPASSRSTARHRRRHARLGPRLRERRELVLLSINRNKESVALDFKAPRGRAILDRLIAGADVLVENFHPGTLDAIGLGYASLAGRDPRLIYCSITGFGATGPLRHRPGYDAVVQAEGG